MAGAGVRVRGHHTGVPGTPYSISGRGFRGHHTQLVAGRELGMVSPEPGGGARRKLISPGDWHRAEKLIRQATSRVWSGFRGTHTQLVARQGIRYGVPGTQLPTELGMVSPEPVAGVRYGVPGTPGTRTPPIGYGVPGTRNRTPDWVWCPRNPTAQLGMVLPEPRNPNPQLGMVSPEPGTGSPRPPKFGYGVPRNPNWVWCPRNPNYRPELGMVYPGTTDRS